MDMWNAIRAEGKRLFRYRFFVFLLFLLLTGNILWFSLSHSLGWGNEKIKAGEYRQLAEEIRTGRVTGADMEQAIEEIFAKLWEYIPKYSDDYRSEYALYDLLLKEVSETDGYGAVLDGIVGNVQQVGNGLIKDNGYLYKRNQKIYRTYGRLSAENVGFLGSYGIRAAMSFDIWDVSVLLLMVMIVYYMFLYDGELQRYGLLFSHAFSKKKLFAARFLLSLLVCGTVLLFGYLIRLLLSQYLYGRMDFSAPVQCVYGASYAVMTLSVGGFFLLFLAGKLLLFFLLLSLFALVAVCVRKRSFYFVLLSMLFGVSYLLYRYIDGNSNLIMLRQINLLTFLHTDEVFLAYDMVRLLNSPVDLLTVFWTTCAVGGILFTVAAMQLFPKLNRKNSRFLTEYRTYTKRHLLSYEWKKLLFCGRGLAVILLFAGISLYLYQPAHERLSNKDEIYYKYYVKKAEGGEIEEKLSYLLEEESRLNEMEQKISGSEYIHESVLTYYGEQLKRKPGLLAALTYA